MTRIWRASLAVAAAALAAGCSDGHNPVEAETGDPLLARVAAMGFDIFGIVDRGDHFVVEGDIILRKSELPPLPDRLQPSFQYRTTNRVGYSYYYDLRVDYSQVESQSLAWAIAIEQAMQAWNAIPGSEARMVKWEPGQYYGPHITISFGSCGDAGIACADFPTASGAPGAGIYIAQPGHAEKVAVIVHELGHTLGLRHTNWNNRTCLNQYQQPYLCNEGAGAEGAVHIPNTPTSTFGGPQSDPHSIMNATVGYWNGFSTYDRVAVRYLFPGGPGPVASGYLSGNTPVIEWDYMQDAVAYQIYYQDYVQVYDPVFGSWPQERYTWVGSTNGLSWTDYSRSFSYTGCPWFWGTGYVVRAVFAEGTQTWYGAMACFS